MGNAQSVNLPSIPDLIGVFVKLRVRWCKAPAKIFPDLDELSNSDDWARFKYYGAALFLSFACHSVVGILLTIIRNRVGKNSEYLPLDSKEQDQAKDQADFFKRLLRGRALIGAVVAGWFIFYAVSLKYLLAANAISRKGGLAWEAWLIWINLHCFFGLLEVIVSMVLQPGHRSLVSYPKAMFVTLLPFFSEKFDSVKDVVFIGIAFHEGEVVLGYACWSVLCVSQAYFVYHPSTRGEIIESYIPCLVMPPRETGTSRNKFEKLVHECKMFVLKQTSDSRRRITILEDLPQGAGMIYFALRHAGSLFVLITSLLSLCRLSLSVFLGPFIHERLAEPLRIQRREAAIANNAAKVLSTAKTIWEFAESDPSPELKEVGFAIVELAQEGLTVRQMKLGGFSFQDCVDAWGPTFTLKDVLDAPRFREFGDPLGKLSHMECLEFGISAQELKDNGATVRDFKSAGWSAAKCLDQLADAFDAEEFIGYPLTELKKHYTAQQLMDAHFTIDALEEEFTDLELSRCNVTPGDLFRGNVDIVRMHRNFNISLRELINPDNRVREENFKNNFTVREFLEDKHKHKFSFGEILKIGFNKPEDFEEVEVTTKTKPGEKGSIERIEGRDPNFELYVKIENSDRLVKETPDQVYWVEGTGKKTSSAFKGAHVFRKKSKVPTSKVQAFMNSEEQRGGYRTFKLNKLVEVEDPDKFKAYFELRTQIQTRLAGQQCLWPEYLEEKKNKQGEPESWLSKPCDPACTNGVSFLASEDPECIPLDDKLNEVYLWHASEKWNDVLTKGFEPSSDSTEEAFLGEGMYFSESLEQAHRFAKKHEIRDADGDYVILLCRVLLGRPKLAVRQGIKEDEELKFYWKRCDISEDVYAKKQAEEGLFVESNENKPRVIYDSLLGEANQSSRPDRAFVVFRKERIFPEYIVKYIEPTTSQGVSSASPRQSP